VVDLQGGPTRHLVTCQILPPNIQGYEPFCPYTLEPDNGVWSARDLDRAQNLIRDAHAVREKVTVWIATGPDPAGFGADPVGTMRYIVKVLNEIGLDAELKKLPPNKYVDAISAGKPQAYIWGWGLDYAHAGNFISTVFRCKALGNVSGLCDRSLDSAMDDAAGLQATDPAAANRAWIAIDHQLVKDAIWAPLTNPLRAYAFSARTENIQVNPQWGVLLSRLWVQ
jgi:peptide/nickel transport system substrate-binding protein